MYSRVFDKFFKLFIRNWLSYEEETIETGASWTGRKFLLDSVSGSAFDFSNVDYHCVETI